MEHRISAFGNTETLAVIRRPWNFSGVTILTFLLLPNIFYGSEKIISAFLFCSFHGDLITGKRYRAHNDGDPGAFDPAVLYWFEFIPGKNPQWITHLIDDNSGIGLSFIVEDMNNDHLLDIIISNKKGVFFFRQIRK